MADDFTEGAAEPAESTDTFTETTSQSWGGRILNSLKGILFGLILVPAAIFLLFWNEERVVTAAASIREGAAVVVDAPTDKVLKANHLKLIHLSGHVRTDEGVRDPRFLIGGDVLRVRRKAEIFQWTEKKSTRSDKNLGGSVTETTTYSYHKVWAEGRIDSSRFKHPEGHANPQQPAVSSASFEARKVMLGAFELPTSIVRKMQGDEARPVTEADLQKLPEDLKTQAKIQGDEFYFGANPEQPGVGDVRVSFEILKPGPFSVLGRQTGNTLEAFPTRAGGVIERVERGAIGADAMFRHAEIENAVMTWILRALGFALMMGGFGLIMRPFSVFADVIPLLGDIIEVGIFFVALVCAAFGSMMTIAVAWFAARPLLAGFLMGGAALLLFLGRSYGARRIKARAS